MKKISQTTIEQLRSISADDLVVHGVVREAPNHRRQGSKLGYCCPMCGSGEGGNHSNGVGDGAGTFDAKNRFYCHACGNANNGGHKLSTIDLFAISRNMQHDNFGEVCKQMAHEFGLVADFEKMELSRPSRRRTGKKINFKIEPPVDTAEKEMIQMIRQDLSVSDDSLIEYLSFNNNQWRGLPLDILQRHGCKFVANWTSPKSRLQKKFSTPTPRMLIPTGDSYLARLTCKLDAFDERTQKYIEEKEHAGTKQLFNADVLNADEPVICVEGYVDAMSIEFAGFKAVALGGRNRGDLLIKAISNMKKKPKIIILLDADESGRESAPELFNALIDIDCPCVVRFLTADESKLDCNQILVEQGLDALQDRLQSLVDDSLAELDAVTRELEKEKHSSLSDDLLNFLFDGKTSDLQFAYRLEKFCGDRVRWLTDDERWLIYSDGVWKRSGNTNSAVSHFGRKLADTMNQYATTKDERELADKFQSAKKIGSAINLLKSCDSIRITLEDLDQHGELLCVKNGVVDLSDGKLYPHDSTRLITQQCRANFQPNASSETVTKFFESIMPDEMTRHGLIRWLGYSLSGETAEEKFAIWTGASGANGKGTLSGTLLELFGSYATGLAPRALLKSNKPADADKATAALNGLEGVRFAISEELPLDGELDSSLVKNLTGGDRINLRRNYGEYRTIRSTAKINLSGNFAPKIENVHDGGILRRMINFAFNVQFGTPENPADHALKKKMLLPENLSALLSVLVREAVAWYHGDGLIISPLMKHATEQHLSQNDFILEFVEENFVFVKNASVRAKDFIEDLRKEYPRECSRFKRADLIQLVANISSDVTYTSDRTKTKIFKGIGKAAHSFDGEPVADNDIPD